MDIEEALQIADRTTNRNLSWAEHPPLMHVVYALEIVAAEYRHSAKQATEWKDKAYRENAAGEESRAAMADWLDFVSGTLGVDVEVEDIRAIVGEALADARLFRRVRELVNGKFVAGDALNAFNDTLAATMEPKGYTTRATPEGVWSAPAGTDPKDLSKWTRLGDVADFTLNAEFPKLTKLMAADVGEAFRKPGREPVRFEPYAPEPSARVKRVRKTPPATIAGLASSSFTRIGKTVNGLSVWHEDAQPDATVLWGWPDVVRHGAVEIL